MNISELIETVKTVLGQAIVARCFVDIQSVLYYFPGCSASQSEERTYPFAESISDILQRHSADLIGITVGN